jgi:hypothetical protein|tara:strand:- start:480 stop:764 length:285 start_codon:yes stop_codon:yes gene_type:complete
MTNNSIPLNLAAKLQQLQTQQARVKTNLFRSWTILEDIAIVQDHDAVSNVNELLQSIIGLYKVHFENLNTSIDDLEILIDSASSILHHEGNLND